MLALACAPVSSDFTQSESELAINPQTERELLTSATLLALGDSYTIGQSVAEKDRWPEQLARSLEDHCLRLQLSIIAQTGWTTDELADSLQDASFSPPYDLVSLLVGVNNQFRGFPITDFENEFRELLEQAIILAGDQPAHVLVISIPDWAYTPSAPPQSREQISIEIDQHNSIARELSLELGANFIDITPISRMALEDPSLLAADSLHPSAEMYGRWVALILPIALNSLNLPE